MGRKGWFRSMKKAMGSDSKDQTDQGVSKSKKKWFGKKEATDPIPRTEESWAETTATSTTATSTSTTTANTASMPPPVAAPQGSETEEMQKQHTSSIAIATANAASAALAAAQAAAELARLTNTPCFPGKSKEEGAAIRIQTAFRGYTARRALRVLRGLARLRTLMQGPSVKRQTTNALKCMQTLVRVQYEIQARRLRTTEENQARQRQRIFSIMKMSGMLASRPRSKSKRGYRASMTRPLEGRELWPIPSTTREPGGIRQPQSQLKQCLWSPTIRTGDGVGSSGGSPLGPGRTPPRSTPISFPSAPRSTPPPPAAKSQRRSSTTSRRSSRRNRPRHPLGRRFIRQDPPPARSRETQRGGCPRHQLPGPRLGLRREQKVAREED